MKKISYFSGKVNGSSWTVFWTLLSMLSHKRNTRRFSGFRRKFSDVFGHLRAFANPWIVDCSQNRLIWESHLFYQCHLTETFIKEWDILLVEKSSHKGLEWVKSTGSSVDEFCRLHSGYWTSFVTSLCHHRDINAIHYEIYFVDIFIDTAQVWPW